MIVLVCLFVFSMILCGIGTFCEDCGFVGVLGGFLLSISILFIVNFNSKPEPTALDVYHNKTTLQITYVDSIPTDTVVVFKEELK